MIRVSQSWRRMRPAIDCCTWTLKVHDGRHDARSASSPTRSAPHLTSRLLFYHWRATLNQIFSGCTAQHSHVASTLPRHVTLPSAAPWLLVLEGRCFHVVWSRLVWGWGGNTGFWRTLGRKWTWPSFPRFPFPDFHLHNQVLRQMKVRLPSDELSPRPMIPGVLIRTSLDTRPCTWVISSFHVCSNAREVGHA